jgi:hypothetical protein
MITSTVRMTIDAPAREEALRVRRSLVGPVRSHHGCLATRLMQDVEVEVVSRRHGFEIVEALLGEKATDRGSAPLRAAGPGARRRGDETIRRVAPLKPGAGKRREMSRPKHVTRPVVAGLLAAALAACAGSERRDATPSANPSEPPKMKMTGEDIC